MAGQCHIMQTPKRKQNTKIFQVTERKHERFKINSIWLNRQDGIVENL